MTARDTALVDIDGTLVDTNYQHALAWFRAFRQFDMVIPLWRIHRHIGMGGDQLVGAVAGAEAEKQHGDKIRHAWNEEFNEVINEITPLPGARGLLEEVRNRGHRVVLASSGKPEHIEHYIDLLDIRSLVDGWTTSDDVNSTKPAPDLLQAAAEKVDAAHPVVIGDTTWDCAAARRIDLPMIGVLTGGFCADELRTAGAAWVFESPADLRTRLDETPLR